MAEPVSASLAVLPGRTYRGAVVRPPGFSRPLHDLLPSRIPDPGCCRTGAVAPIMVALGRARRDIASCLAGIFFVYTHDFDNERDASGAAANFILDHSQPGDAVVFHIAGTRIPYEFVRSLRAGENTASPDIANQHFNFTDQFGPQILFPYHGAGLDYRDFTGKPTADFVRTIAPSHPRVWVMLMNNGPAGNPDPTTVMLTHILPESFPKMLRWQFTRVEVRVYSK